MSVGDDILLSIQEQICVEAFPKISTYGVPKLKQQEHQWFSCEEIWPENSKGTSTFPANQGAGSPSYLHPPLCKPGMEWV